MYAIRSYYGKYAKHAVNQASINQTDVSLACIPFCSIQEQNKIVSEIESRLSVCDKVEQSITESIAKAEALRQSILKKAFVITSYSIHYTKLYEVTV